MRSPPSEPIALVDMDGTLCDYAGEMNRELALLRSPDEPDVGLHHGPDEPAWLRARRQLIQQRPGWWRELPRLERGFAVVEVMRRLWFDLHILTKGPWGNAVAWSEKVSWCRAHVPDATLHISEDKGLVYGKVLMDDYPGYIARWLAWRPRGLVIMPVWSWNHDAFADDPRVLPFDGTNLAEVEDRLWAVRQTSLYAEAPASRAASADEPCATCGKALGGHPRDLAALDGDRQPYLRVACDGERVATGG